MQRNMKTEADMKMTAGNWLPLAGLTCAAFIFNTSEFIPIGLLTDIAGDFHITEARAGMLISVYAWIVMLLSLPLMMWASKTALRKLMLWVIALFTVFQVCSSVSSGYYMLMLSRAGVACSHAVFWAIVSPLAVKIVPESSRPLALSMIVTGTSVAMIFGLPLGRMIGLYIGWRMTFLCVGAFSFLTLIYLSLVLPGVQSDGGFSWKQLPQLLGNPLLVGLYLLSLAVAAAYYTGYSYIEPFLKQVAAMDDHAITMTLMVFGAAGILGSFAFSRYYGRMPYLFMSTVILCISLCLLLLFPLSSCMYAVILLCSLWGMSVTAFNVAMQSEIINCSPAAGTSVSMAIFSGIFNLGIGCGTFFGGEVCTYASISYIGYAAGALALLAFFYWFFRVRKLLVKP